VAELDSYEAIHKHQLSRLPRRDIEKERKAYERMLKARSQASRDYTEGKMTVRDQP